MSLLQAVAPPGSYDPMTRGQADASYASDAAQAQALLDSAGPKCANPKCGKPVWMVTKRGKISLVGEPGGCHCAPRTDIGEAPQAGTPPLRLAAAAEAQNALLANQNAFLKAIAVCLKALAEKQGLDVKDADLPDAVAAPKPAPAVIDDTPTGDPAIDGPRAKKRLLSQMS